MLNITREYKYFSRFPAEQMFHISDRRSFIFWINKNKEPSCWRDQKYGRISSVKKK